MITLYNTLILVNLNCCIETWGNSPKSKLNFIETLLKRTMHMIYKKEYNMNCPDDLFRKLHFLTINELIEYSWGKMGHKASLEILPPKIQHFFDKIENIHQYNIGSKQIFIPPTEEEISFKI
jgi:hypothetical protein